MKTFKFRDYEIMEEYWGPGYEPRFTVKRDNISIVMDYSNLIYVELNVDSFNNDSLVPITIYKNDIQLGKVYRKLNNGCPYHDEDIIEMLACYTGMDDMEDIFRFLDECFE